MIDQWIHKSNIRDKIREVIIKQTLYDKLKPEIKAKLEASYAEGYVTSNENIFKKLKTKNR